MRPEPKHFLSLRHKEISLQMKIISYYGIAECLFPFLLSLKVNNWLEHDHHKALHGQMSNGIKFIN